MLVILGRGLVLYKKHKHKKKRKSKMKKLISEQYLNEFTKDEKSKYKKWASILGISLGTLSALLTGIAAHKYNKFVGDIFPKASVARSSAEMGLFSAANGGAIGLGAARIAIAIERKHCKKIKDRKARERCLNKWGVKTRY